MTPIHIRGIDTGLVHSAAVSMRFVPDLKTVVVQHFVVDGLDAKKIADWLEHKTGGGNVARTYIEKYRPRSHFDSDKRMVQGERDFVLATGGKVLDNTGIKTVVKQPLLELLGVWSFTTVTHHQDLRSAARIAVLGMMKEDDTNLILADIVKAHLDKEDWLIRQA